MSRPTRSSLLLTCIIAGHVDAFASPGCLCRSCGCLCLTLQTRPQVKPIDSRSRVVAQLNNNIDTKLVAADATLIFAFSFTRTLGIILTDPNFPGWFAPITADPVRLSSTILFASLWASSWSASGIALGAFAPGVGSDAIKSVGAGNAARCFALASALYAATALVATGACAPDMPPAPLRINLDNAVAAVGVGLSLGGWRAFLAERIPR